MIFADRIHAGEVLADELTKLKLNSKESVVAAIPRGGVIVGWVIAQRLKIPLTVVVIKKIGAPFNSELAIGAVASHGAPVLDYSLIAELGVSKDYLKKETIKKRREAKTREKLLGCEISEDQFRDKTVIVVDDGLATGQTAKAATKIIAAFGPQKLILAVACASPQALDLLSESYDKVICPAISADFMAVGQFYRDFRPVDDEQVKVIIKKQLTPVES